MNCRKQTTINDMCRRPIGRFRINTMNSARITSLFSLEKLSATSRQNICHSIEYFKNKLEFYIIYRTLLIFINIIIEAKSQIFKKKSTSKRNLNKKFRYNRIHVQQQRQHTNTSSLNDLQSQQTRLLLISSASIGVNCSAAPRLL